MIAQSNDFIAIPHHSFYDLMTKSLHGEWRVQTKEEIKQKIFNGADDDSTGVQALREDLLNFSWILFREKVKLLTFLMMWKKEHKLN